MYFELFIIGVALYYIKRWTRGKVMHHPGLQTIDALDRMLQWMMIVAAVWFSVAVARYGISLLQLGHEIRAGMEQVPWP